MADQKATQLTELTTVADGDILYIVDDPGGTPISKKITKVNLVGSGGSTFAKVVKPTDETVTNSITLQDDDDLKFTPSVSKTYFVMLFLIIKTDGSPDFKMAWSVPTGATVDGSPASSVLFRDNTEVDFNTDKTASVAITVANTNDKGAGFLFRIKMSTTAGDCIVQWAQNVSSAIETKVLEGSLLLVWEE